MKFRRAPLVSLFVLGLLGCGGDEELVFPDKPPVVDPPPPPPPTNGLCAAKTLAPWSRKLSHLGGSVSINEVMYHPKSSPDLEWIELYNPLGIDVDVSGFRLDGDVEFLFAPGTFIPSRGYLVVAANADLLAQEAGKPIAIGTYTGRLSDDSGKIELWNNAGRLLDSMEYADVEPWPVVPDGSGASLSKKIAGAASDTAEEWTRSARVGGTPGAPNFPEEQGAQPPLTLVPFGATWKYLNSGTNPPANWTTLAFDDAAWTAAPASFYSTNVAPMPINVNATFTADNFFAIYVGKKDGSGLKYIGRDSQGDWTSAESFPFVAGPDDYVFVAAWEAPFDNGGPQSLIGQFALPGNLFVSTTPVSFEWTLGPPNASPGGASSDPAPALAAIQSVVATANQNQSWTLPQAFADRSSAPWGPALSGVFVPGTQFIWADTFNDVSISNTNTTYILFRSRVPLVPAKGTTQLPLGPTTTYFRTTFDTPNDIEFLQPWLDTLVDDGAVFYLNGTEILRLRMPAGQPNASTLASSTVTNAILESGNLFAPAAFVSGKNVLAVEVHQAAANDVDMTFDALLASSVAKKSQTETTIDLAFHEVAGAQDESFWVELKNNGSAPLDLQGYVIASSNGAEYVLPADSLDPGGLLQIDAGTLGFGAKDEDKLFLLTPDRQIVSDGVRILDVARGRKDKALAFFYEDESTPGKPNVFVEHDEIAIHEIMYHPVPEKGPDGKLVKGSLEWVELFNRSALPVDISGFQLVDAIQYSFPKGSVVPAGGYVVVTNDIDAFKTAYPAVSASTGLLLGDYKGGLADSGENLLLLDACGNPADSVHYYDDGRWPEFADGGGSSLELRDPRADNASPEAWAPSDEGARSDWQTITYEGVAEASSLGPDGTYHEFILGMLEAGTVLVDDVSVIENPSGANTELVQNGTFEVGGATSWRLLGNHRHAEVIEDPTKPGNHVLRIQATGPTEHMHNHVETTLAAGQTIKNGTNYRVSLRAKWLGGSNQLNTRLYFNRLAKTTELLRPSSPGTPLAANGKAEKNIGPTYVNLQHSPVVPQPYEPIRVSVEAADPDGISDLVLMYSVNGGSFSNFPMTSDGSGRYSAMVPGDAAGTIYQFYVTGKDSAGATSMFPAKGPDSRALWKVDDGLASMQGLHNVRILLPPADTNWLFDPKNLMSNDVLPTTIIDDERRAYYDAGVRLKSSERGRPEVARVGFALRFQPNEPFRGIFDSFNVDRSEGIGYGQRELLFRQAMNHAGTVTSHYDDLVKVLTPKPEHVGPAHLQMTRFGDLLLDYQFENGGDGDLFEYELIYYPLTTDNGSPQGYKLPQPDSVVGTSIRDLGDDEEAYRLPFIIKNNRWRDDYSGLIQFAKVFGLNGSAFDTQIDNVIDSDEWLRAFAFGVLSGTIDNYAAGSQHNANFYRRPSDGRMLYFPHDLDFYGGSPNSAIVPSGDLAKLIANPVRRRAYYGHLYDIINTSYNGTYMEYWATHLGQLLPAQDFSSHLQFIIARSNWVLTGAPDAITKAIPQVAFAITTNGGNAMSVTTSSVTLDGTGWIDVASLMNANAPVMLTWTNQTSWQTTVALNCGLNSVKLDAFNRQGQAVGSDTIAVTRSGNGCP